MPRKPRGLKNKPLSRSLAVSLAGVRAGGALAVDSAMQRVLGKNGDHTDSAFARREAQRFAEELGRLKGTYVKIGQLLALFGEQFLPAVLVEALRDLADRTEALPWQDVEEGVRHSLGKRYAELDIDPNAIAAASLSQVHLARIRASDEWICLKVQYPGLAELIDSDFDAVVRMLTLARWVQGGRDLDDWLASLRVHLHHEIDYFREARLLRSTADKLGKLPDGMVSLQVPQLFDRYCTETVLAMEFVDGYSVADPAVLALPLPRRNALAEAMLELFFFEVYHWGALQTDPNFGNYLLCLDDRRRNSGRDRIVLLDFGSVMECDGKFLADLRLTIDAGLREDESDLIKGLTGLGCLQPSTSEEGKQLFARFCIQLLEPLRPPERLPAEYLNSQGRYCWGQSQLMQRAGRLGATFAATRHFSRPSRDFALLARKLSGLFNFIALLDAEFNGYGMATRYISGWHKGKRYGKQG
ncbi:MAG: AarF/ABC1/UbiB kinase family protein [Pseudomonadota bacterium]